MVLFFVNILILIVEKEFAIQNRVIGSHGGRGFIGNDLLMGANFLLIFLIYL